MSLQNTLQETERKVDEIREFAANKAGESEESRIAPSPSCWDAPW